MRCGPAEPEAKVTEGQVTNLEAEQWLEGASDKFRQIKKEQGADSSGEFRCHRFCRAIGRRSRCQVNFNSP